MEVRVLYKYKCRLTLYGGAYYNMPPLPELVHDSVKYVVLLWRSMPLEVLAGFQHLAMELSVLLRCHLFQSLLQLRDIQRGYHDGKLSPVQDVLEGQVVMVGNDHGHTTVVHRIAKTSGVHLVTFRVKAEFAC